MTAGQLEMRGRLPSGTADKCRARRAANVVRPVGGPRQSLTVSLAAFRRSRGCGSLLGIQQDAGGIRIRRTHGVGSLPGEGAAQEMALEIARPTPVTDEPTPWGSLCAHLQLRICRSKAGETAAFSKQTPRYCE